jgi:hypothetical protein
MQPTPWTASERGARSGRHALWFQRRSWRPRGRGVRVFDVFESEPVGPVALAVLVRAPHGWRDAGLVEVRLCVSR